MARIPNGLKDSCLSWCEITKDKTVTTYRRINGKWTIEDRFELTEADHAELSKSAMDDMQDLEFVGYLYPEQQYAPLFMRKDHKRMINGITYTNAEYYRYLLRD